jgi:hypothetical protein
MGTAALMLRFTSAAGYYTVRGDLRDTDGQAIESWVAKYCREHPADPIYHGADALVDELAKPDNATENGG